MINILLFFMCLMTSRHTQRVEGMSETQNEDLHLERQLKLINKFPVKSIHTKFGYIVDCIDINKQSAFDHPLLKNHKLQRKPSFQQTKAEASVNNSPVKTKIGFEKVSCPIGTVPIRRTTKEDLIRAKSLFNTHILTQENPGSHVAQVVLIPSTDSYHGVSGLNSVYNPKVNKDQTSAAHLWVQNGEADGINKITVGWHVSPQLHGGDESTYIYSFWTSDNFKNTGCYNLQCPGFIQIDRNIYIGSPVKDTSVYDGDMVELPISLSQDADTKNWWLNIASTNVGYFPATLFSNMLSANHVGWGGETTTPVGTPSPPMGSGHFPDENYVHACYFRHIAFQNESTQYRSDYEPESHRITTFSDKQDCFGIAYYNEGPSTAAKRALQFGGPGGDCDN